MVKQPEIREQKAITPPGRKVKGKGSLLPEPSENRRPEGSNLTACQLSAEGKEQEPRGRKHPGRLSVLSPRPQPRPPPPKSAGWEHGELPLGCRTETEKGARGKRVQGLESTDQPSCPPRVR